MATASYMYTVSKKNTLRSEDVFLVHTAPLLIISAFRFASAGLTAAPRLTLYVLGCVPSGSCHSRLRLRMHPHNEGRFQECLL